MGIIYFGAHFIKSNTLYKNVAFRVFITGIKVFNLPLLIQNKPKKNN